ncbi:MAG: flagellin [Methanosarcinaceae archaeon]|nr:flagellin [Methanosarcinaceae archaeon]
MKANSNLYMRKDTRAQVGIGTLIIFIAMVLVAAVAAAVLIQTSGVLQQKAQATGKETVQEVASNIAITQIVGARSSATSNDFDHLNVTLRVMAGADAIDLRQVKLTLQNETKRIENIGYIADGSAGAQSSTEFYVVEMRDDDSSLDASTTTTTVINSGDLVYLVLKPGTAMTVPTREPVRLELKPEFGGIVVNDLITPSSYGVKINLVLYP